MTHVRKDIKQKTEEMIEQGTIKTSDFKDLDEWKGADATNRSLTEEEQDKLRLQARQALRKHREQKKPTA